MSPSAQAFGLGVLKNIRYSHLRSSNVSVKDGPDGVYQGIEDVTVNAKMWKSVSRTREERRSAYADLKHAHASSISKRVGNLTHCYDRELREGCTRDPRSCIVLSI